MEKKYTTTDLEHDQKCVVSHVISSVKQWIECDNVSDYELLRLTISGIAGSGKSTVINTLATLVREMFNIQDTVVVCAPTGSAAYNAGGETCHRMIGKNETSVSIHATPENKKRLLNKLRHTIVLIIDERSLLSASLLGLLEQHCRECANLGTRQTDSWGGIPIVILVGDDYQLPSVEPGAFYSLDQEKRNKILSRMKNVAQMRITDNGWNEFINMSKTVMKLNTTKRVKSGDTRLQRILNAVRGEQNDFIDPKDIEHMMKLHLEGTINHKNSYTTKEAEMIKNNGLMLFATKAPRDQYNMEMTAKCSHQKKTSGHHQGNHTKKWTQS